MPTLEEVRELVGGMFLEVAPQITTEDSKKIRELVRNSAIRDDRRLSPKELETVATVADPDPRGARAAEQAARQGDRARRRARSPSTSTACSRAALQEGQALRRGRGARDGVDEKALEKAADLGKGLLKDVLEQADRARAADDLRELTNDLCLRTDGKIAKEDLDAIVQWLVKVREMYQDMESRKEDAKEAAVDSVRRLEETWTLFRELEPKLIVNDEQIFRELKDRFGSPYGFGVYFQGGMGAESIRELLKDLDLKAEAKSLRETISTSKGQKQQRAIKRLKVVNAFITSENRPEWMILEAIP
jgi:hypothetical protein